MISNTLIIRDLSHNRKALGRISEMKIHRELWLGDLQMNIERVVAKFGLKDINYEPSKGGKALMTLEEYLATVGIAWK